MVKEEGKSREVWMDGMIRSMTRKGVIEEDNMDKNL